MLFKCKEFSAMYFNVMFVTVVVTICKRLHAKIPHFAFNAACPSLHGMHQRRMLMNPKL